MSWIKSIAIFFAYVAFLIVVVAILLEAIFRMLPTTSPVNLLPIKSEKEILRFKANQTGTFSLGANFYKTVTKKTNNAGFYSNFNYEEKKSPEIMIIGDSYVEAAQIKNSDTFGELIKLQDETQFVYQMGVSGIPLSQYIKMADYAKKYYLPEHYVIVIVGNDFDQSLCESRVKEGIWCFDEYFELKFIPFNGYEGFRKFARQSAFIRYLVFQGGINWHQLILSISLKAQGKKIDTIYAGNVERFKDREIINKSLRVVDRFMEELTKLQIINKVTLVLDADRLDIYNEQQSDSYFQKMRDYTIDRANIYGINLIDMEPIFKNDYNSYGIKFDFPTDGHWNERAHKLLTEALMKSL
ncbi:hypothetical protein N8370_04430 [Amylibacter sp.]|nr:hypothetical protein [Amylibacter sp.]